MVVYDLICKKQHRFEGWFPSFEDFQKQAEKRLISCPQCGSKKIEKLPHACAVHIKKEAPLPAKKEASVPAVKQPEPAEAPPTPAEVNEMLIRLHHFVKENFEDVGSRFAEEARSIHKGEAEERPIHGTATPQEREELQEEGVPHVILPKPDLDS